MPGIRRVPALLLLALLVVGLGVASMPSPAYAQALRSTDAATIGGSVDVAGLADDETNLGNGVGVAAEASTRLGPFMRVGVEAAGYRHSRNSGYLAASSTLWHLLGRADLLLAPQGWRARPFVGTALGVAHSTGTLSVYTFGPRGTTETMVRLPWTHTKPAWDLHLGVRIAASPRLAVRPELSAGMIATADTPGTLELPLLRLRAGVAVEWARR